MDFVLEVREISKHFGRVRALESVSFGVSKGEIVGLLGDNGAGKSTVIKIISGIERPDKGHVLVDGHVVVMRSPEEARDRGIETVYQDLALVPGMPVWRNFFLGHELVTGPAVLGRLAKGHMRASCMRALEALGVGNVMSPDSMVDNLSGGQRQALAIGRALHFGASVLLLDEPTAAMALGPTKRILGAVSKARDMGAAVILISHDVADVYHVCDRFVLLEQGCSTWSVPRAEVSMGELVGVLIRKHAAVHGYGQ